MSEATTTPPSPAEAAQLPGLAGNGIALRPLEAIDTDALYEAARSSRVELSRWMPWCHAKYARNDAAGFAESRAEAWASGSEYAFAIWSKADERLLGMCGLNEIRTLHRFANLGYWVRTEATGRGVASTAARLLARFGFLHLGLLRIEVVAAVDNVPSQRAALKAGATREGVLRNRLLIHGVAHDAVMFSFVARDLGIAPAGE